MSYSTTLLPFSADVYKPLRRTVVPAYQTNGVLRTRCGKDRVDPRLVEDV